MQIGRFEDAACLLTEIQADLISKENALPSRGRSNLLELIEKRLSQKELSLVRNRRELQSAVETGPWDPITCDTQELGTQKEA
jgi:hypothetical protein